MSGLIYFLGRRFGRRKTRIVQLNGD